MSYRRIEVNDFRPGRAPRTTVVYVPAEVDPATVQVLAPVVDRLMADAGGLAPLAVVAALAERLADEQAYEREAGRRGVLAL